MNTNAEVYDLGNVDTTHERQSPAPSQTTIRESRPASQPARLRSEVRKIPASGFERERSRNSWTVGFSLFVPGSSHILCGEFTRGLAFLASVGFFGTLCWAILGSLDRLGATLGILGLPPHGGVWALGVLFVLAAAMHVANVISAAPTRSVSEGGNTPHPVVAGLASLLIPGWGQALSGHRLSAALFLTGCWLVGGTWILASPPVQGLLESQGLYLPKALAVLISAPVRWALPVVLWSLAVYDAAFRAARMR